MTHASAALVASIREGLAQRGDPVRAVATQAYMKSAMPYLGMSMATLREVCGKVVVEHRLGTFEAWRDTVLLLWHEAQFREERYAALFLVGHRFYRAFRTLDALPLYEELIVTGAWWDLVDGLASHEIGDLLRAHPEQMRPRLLAWSRGDNVWLRRTAIICQIGSKRATDVDLLFACIEPSLGEKDFFLRKGIGWALREYAKVDPDTVLRYVQDHAAQLSGLSKREALKHVAGLQSAAASV